MKKLLVSFMVVLTFVFILTGCGDSGKQSVSGEKEIPSIPHRVDSTMVCADCHKDGKNKAPVTKHLDRSNCIQCHKKGN